MEDTHTRSVRNFLAWEKRELKPVGPPTVPQPVPPPPHSFDNGAYYLPQAHEAHHYSRHFANPVCLPAPNASMYPATYDPPLSRFQSGSYPTPSMEPHDFPSALPARGSVVATNHRSSSGPSPPDYMRGSYAQQGTPQHPPPHMRDSVYDMRHRAHLGSHGAHSSGEDNSMHSMQYPTSYCPPDALAFDRRYTSPAAIERNPPPPSVPSHLTIARSDSRGSRGRFSIEPKEENVSDMRLSLSARSPGTYSTTSGHSYSMRSPAESSGRSRHDSSPHITSRAMPIPGRRSREDIHMGESWDSMHSMQQSPHSYNYGPPPSRSFAAGGVPPASPPANNSRKWSESHVASSSSARHTTATPYSIPPRQSNPRVSYDASGHHILPRTARNSTSMSTSAPAPSAQIKSAGVRRREIHNTNERKRRDDLRECYQRLASVLPDLSEAVPRYAPLQLSRDAMHEDGGQDTGGDSDNTYMGRAIQGFTNTSVLNGAVRHIRLLKQQGGERRSVLDYLKAEQVRLQQRIKELAERSASPASRN